jgi:hypothetical protein
MAEARNWSTVRQNNEPLVLEETLPFVPGGRESAKTTINQEDAANPPPADQAAAAALSGTAVMVETKPLHRLLTINNILFAQGQTLSCFTVSFS